MIRSTVAAELAKLYRERKGLNPEFVVRWAKAHPRSALHSRFEWNNGRAAHAYRLWQARALTTVVVEYPDRVMRQVYVSTLPSRGTPAMCRSWTS